MLEKQKQFMEACGQTTDRPNWKQIELYAELIREEIVGELFPALESWLANSLDEEALRETLDAIGDSLVVLNGLALSMGTDPKEIKDRIDISNLSKIPKGEDKIKKRVDGKILKPLTFVDPRLDDLVDIVIGKIVNLRKELYGKS